MWLVAILASRCASAFVVQPAATVRTASLPGSATTNFGFGGRHRSPFVPAGASSQDISRLGLASLSDLSSITTSVVEVFDGSTIVDPVVVSDVFWTSLKGKFLALLIGQVLAAIAFAIITSVAASQISKLGSWVSSSVFAATNDKESPRTSPVTNKPFIRADQKPIAPDFSKLLVCLAIDVLGTSSEIVPVLGEFTDIIYAPIAASLLRSLYGSNVIFALEFAEEILPFTDIIPLATLCWVVDTFFADSDVARTLQLGSYRNNVDPRDVASGVVDVDAKQVADRQTSDADGSANRR